MLQNALSTHNSRFFFLSGVCKNEEATSPAKRSVYGGEEEKLFQQKYQQNNFHLFHNFYRKWPLISLDLKNVLRTKFKIEINPFDLIPINKQ